MNKCLKENVNDLINGNITNSNDEFDDHVQVNNESIHTETSDNKTEDELNNDDIGPVLQIKKSLRKFVSLIPIRYIMVQKLLLKIIKTHFKCFSYFFNDTFINILVRSTNIKTIFVKKKYERIYHR